MKIALAIMVVGTLIELAILAGVIYVVIHFIAKFW